MPDICYKKLRTILAADIGGTNSRFAHFTADEDGGLSLVSQIWLKTAEADSFTSLLDNLRASGFPVAPQNADIVGIAIAGPVTAGVRSKPPLIPWEIDISHAKRDYGFQRCFLINDFVAQAFACISPAGNSAGVILVGFPDRHSAIAVIGAGTGLGKAVLIPDGRGEYSANPSEGAHACFPFVGEKEFAFQHFLLHAHQTLYATYNHVVSGRGLSAIHEFLTGRHLEPAQVVEQFPKHTETLAWFARFYGRACRDFALETFALGGLYITGGVATRNPEIVLHESFRDEFLSSDTMHHMLTKVPVFLVKDQNSGLWGVAVKAVREMTTCAAWNIARYELKPGT
jgi:glucokinase